MRQQLYDLLTTTAKIEETRGETLDWELRLLGISNRTWNKVIHNGIKPIIVFAHPFVLRAVPGSLRYYRMLAMVSQESTSWVRWKAIRYESGQGFSDKRTASAIARYLNQIVSRMIELDDQIDAQEFDLWRGMAVCSEVLWQENGKRKRT